MTLRNRAAHALTQLNEVLENIKRKYGNTEVVHEVGHSHIDAAWLWTYGDTVKKFAKTLSTVLNLANRRKGIVYVQSSAAYYDWLKKHYPDLYNRLVKAVKSGTVIPVGGGWVEQDVILPLGETLAMNMYLGQRYFIRELGQPAEIGWLPDSFGFSANLPQIMIKSGLKYFVTHKLSWMRRGFPYKTF